MKDRTSLHELVSQIDDTQVDSIEIEPCRTVSAEAIQRLALEKIHGEQPEKRIGRMKKKTFAAVIAVAVLLLTATAALAFGGSGFFRSIFGDSVSGIEDYILDANLQAEANGTTMRVESVLSDGYNTHLIVSLEAESGLPSAERIWEHYSVSDAKGLIQSSEWRYMEDFSGKNKQCYDVGLSSKESLNGDTVTIAAQEKELSLALTVDAKLGYREITPDTAAYEGKTLKIQSVKLSPMGVQVVGEKSGFLDEEAGLHVNLLMKDGKRMPLIDELPFLAGENDGSGGGGVALYDDAMNRLCKEVTGHFNPEGQVVVRGQFSRIVQLDEIESVEIDGVAYPIR